MTVSLIVAAAANDVIGRDGGLPWHLPADLRRFRSITMGHVLVMGRRTHESILARLGHPLPGRTSVVVSHRPLAGPAASVVHADCIERAFRLAAEFSRAAGRGEYFVIGGACVYAQALPVADRIYLTRVPHEIAGDTRMPPGWLDGFVLCAQEQVAGEWPAGGFSFLDYRRVGE